MRAVIVFVRTALIWMLALSLGFFSASNHASAKGLLPKIDIPDSWLVCAQDSDCVIAGDACRSCGMLWVVHSRHKAALEKKDLELRQRSGFTPACEACSIQDKKTVCRANRCEIQAN